MKRNKSLLLAALTLAGLMASSTLVRADDPPPPPATPPPAAGDQAPRQRMTAAQREEKLIKDLGITGDKVDKFKAILKEQQTSMADLRKSGATGADLRTKRKEITDATTAKMKTLLDADQFEKWQKLSQPQRGRRGAPGQGTTPAPGTQDSNKL